MRKLISEKLDELGMNMAEASLKIGKNHAYLQQFLKRGIPKKLKEDERVLLAQLLGLAESELRGTSPRLPKKEYSRTLEEPNFVARTTDMSGTRHNLVDKLTHVPTTFGNSDLPVYTTAQGGTGGVLLMSKEAVDWVIRPAPLLQVRDGYGMIVTGDSMSPKIDNGSTALVNPHLPPRNGDTCVFRCKLVDGTELAQLRLLRRYNDETWFVHQYEPQRDYSLKRSEWQCHVVVGSYFGR